MGVRNFNLIGRKIIGVGRNYRAHLSEMEAAIPHDPVIFLKPTSSYVLEPNPILIPEGVEVDHELEFGVVIGRKGANIRAENADSHIAGTDTELIASFLTALGYVLALDLTARSIQNKAKAAGLPWTVAKGYDTFCPVSAYIPKAGLQNPHAVSMWLKVNGELRQQGHTSKMLFRIDKLIEYISSIMLLEEGDLILTGTPDGAGPIRVGDRITAGLGQDYVTMRFRAVPRPAL